MKKEPKDPFRVIGLDRVLFPNMASVFEIADVRLLDALVIERYKDFTSSFMDRVYGGHITGHENIDFNSSMFDLTNTRYVLSTDPIDSQMTSYFIRFARPKPNYIKEYKSLIAVIKEPGSTVFKIPVPPSANGLVFKARSQNTAELRISAGQGQSSSVSLKPEWQKVAVDANSEGNKELSFDFNLTAGQGAEIQIDQMVYRNIKGDRLDRFKLIYDDDILIYENKDALPRAFVAYNYEEFKDSSSLLNSMVEGKNDLSRTVLMEDQLDKKAFKKRKVEPTKVSVEQKGINSLKIVANSRFDGLLFLGDNFYPGWKALVNGKEAEIYRANYTFKAVRVRKGKNIVEFVYNPSSVSRGLIISIAGFLALAFIFGFSIFKTYKKSA
ncbi:MAG: hypothetical protein E3J54_03945 [Actinobacteria bacterium]|nr:MAG: hypothetical protein E3J54_03945 [Actinomycetota bacterium]